MLSFIVRRILQMIPILLGITLITFLLFNTVGGNPAYQFAGKNASPEQIKSIERELGLDRPLPEQYLLYVKQIMSLDFGRSWSTKQEISTMISDGIFASLSLAVPPFVLGTILSISIALFAAYKRGSLMDKSIMVICLSMMSVSFLVYILAFQYWFGYQLGWFPISGWDPDWAGRWQYVMLPGLIWVVVAQGSGILFYRTIILDEVFQDYVRTARSKGLSEPIIFFKHVLKNAMIPIITIVIVEMPALITGSLLLENFFGIPGLGGMVVSALQNSDFPVVKAMTFIGAVLYMIFNLISDICYSLVDPRVRLK